MISVVTPTYNTPPHILARTFASLKAQTFTDWEWVVYDDSADDRVWRQLWGFCADERYNIRPLRGMSNIGSIGKVKRTAFMAAEGDILVELDHDDELTPDCLDEIERALSSGGFAYSDWSEHFEDGSTGRYPEGWAFGYGGEYQVDGDWVMKAPPINRTTLSHIVSAPNHVRAWNADQYRAVGGHDPELPVADDYDLILRTLLDNTAYRYIPKRLYKQHISPKTAQRTRNAEIQRRVGEIHSKYSHYLDIQFGHD